MKLNKMIDHTILKADAKREDVLKYCEEAKEYDFMSVCVNSCNVKIVKKALEGSDVKVCCVVGFPLGAMATETKAFESKYCVDNGADEIDMVINIGALKDENYDYVKKDIEEVVKASNGKVVKVIIETCLLSDEEKKKACELAKEAKADFVKTSTGFSSGGATAEDVKLMKSVVGDELKVKASGGVRTKEDAMKMIEAGADRIGASSGINIVK
ncbi:deoxyribose-phosphate aldolase [Lagierella massiliensis]|uniref:deoxyribose-phosphate aldolase n=1 Tax=Lagierella massiliensis TaxID=1689303 RepID=UPI0006D7C31C|nr:deoxyribose-phosphate aldolase [Lagierella massiliensis]